MDTTASVKWLQSSIDSIYSNIIISPKHLSVHSSKSTTKTRSCPSYVSAQAMFPPSSISASWQSTRKAKQRVQNSTKQQTPQVGRFLPFTLSHELVNRKRLTTLIMEPRQPIIANAHMYTGHLYNYVR